jgi:hypothetical protein
MIARSWEFSVRRTRHALEIIVVVALASGITAPAAAAQDTSSQGQTDVATLSRLVEEQRKQLEEQGRVINDLKTQLDATNKLVAASQKRLNDLEQKSSATSPEMQQRLTTLEQSMRKLPELTEKELAKSEEFPGSVPIPGTDTAIRFGGQVRTVLVRNIGALGTEDRFVTSSIPIQGTPDAAKQSRTTISASASRLGTDFRTPTPFGQLRAFVEGDFAGDNRTYRLRHAFGQWRGFLIGQTWSTFSDPEAEPDGLDFEGLNAISLFRQPEIRWTKPLKQQIELALALENPSPDLTGASGVNQVPDFIVRLRFNFVEDTSKRRVLLPGGGHVQAAVLVRQLRGEPGQGPNQIVSSPGFGLHVSGRVPARWAVQDYVKFAVATGKGFGRYITDLGTLGGQDAVYDSVSNVLIALPVYSAYLGYEHWWTDTLRSTGTFGVVIVDNLEIQTPDSLHQTTRGSFNLSWSPVQRVDLIAEFLSGRRVNKDRQDGRAGQVQLGWIFRF